MLGSTVPHHKLHPVDGRVQRPRWLVVVDRRQALHVGLVAEHHGKAKLQITWRGRNLLALSVTSPSPLPGDDGIQRLRQLISRQLIEVEHDRNAEARETGEVVGLIPEQRDSHQGHSVIQGLVQAVGAAVRHERARLRVTWGEEHLVLLMSKAWVWVCGCVPNRSF